ncbi:MAG: 30S ribosomal protein S8 [Clostridia bacterium]|jgi:small subunit ribosomal protein S8|nr:30S ribosomal protein S8 [Clostridia bacterium]MDD4275567.1 30S ribosomal protein S8 [Clostridia bacterium]
MTTDPISDMLTRLRNAITAHHDIVEVPTSRIKKSIAEILVSEGYITSAEYVGSGVTSTIKITLKYGSNNEKVISGIKRISKPGLRIYAEADKLPKVLNGLGIAIISTSKGVMTDKTARALGTGGEVLAFIW